MVKALHILFYNPVHAGRILLFVIHPHFLADHTKGIFIDSKQICDITLPQVVIETVSGGDIQKPVNLIIHLPHVSFSASINLTVF